MPRLAYIDTDAAAFVDIIQIRLNASASQLIVGTDRNYDRALLLHWLPDQGRTVACSIKECRYCHLPKRKAIFVPVLQAIERTLGWHKGILQVTASLAPMLRVPVNNAIFKVFRTDAANSPPKFSRLETPWTGPEFRGFDIEDSLERCYGEWRLRNNVVDSDQTRGLAG